MDLIDYWIYLFLKNRYLSQNLIMENFEHIFCFDFLLFYCCFFLFFFLLSSTLHVLHCVVPSFVNFIYWVAFPISINLNIAALYLFMLLFFIFDAMRTNKLFFTFSNNILFLHILWRTARTGGVTAALNSITCRYMVIGMDSDLLYPLFEQEEVRTISK